MNWFFTLCDGWEANNWTMSMNTRATDETRTFLHRQPSLTCGPTHGCVVDSEPHAEEE